MNLISVNKIITDVTDVNKRVTQLCLNIAKKWKGHLGLIFLITNWRVFSTSSSIEYQITENSKIPLSEFCFLLVTSIHRSPEWEMFEKYLISFCLILSIHQDILIFATEINLDSPDKTGVVWNNFQKISFDFEDLQQKTLT